MGIIGKIHGSMLYSVDLGGSSKISNDFDAMLQRRIGELSNTNVVIKNCALNELALWKEASASAVPEIVKVLKTKTENYRTRALAAYVLGAIKGNAELAVPALIGALVSDEAPLVREDSAKALGKFGKDAALAISALAVISNRKGEDSYVKAAAQTALDKIRKELA